MSLGIAVAVTLVLLVASCGGGGEDAGPAARQSEHLCKNGPTYPLSVDTAFEALRRAGFHVYTDTESGCAAREA
jgi:hypothetical protein